MRIPQLPHAISQAIKHALELEIPDVLWEAFEKQQEVSDACERTKHDPSVRECGIALGQRTFESSFRAVVTVLSDDLEQPLLQVPMEASLSAVVEIITVKVQGGRLVGFGGGKATCSATLSVMETNVVSTAPKVIEFPPLIDVRAHDETVASWVPPPRRS
jgi:hypothetical protein